MVNTNQGSDPKIQSTQNLIPEKSGSLDRLLSDDDVPAPILVRAVQKIIGAEKGWEHWESETIEIELDRLGYSISEVNWNKLLAALSLIANKDVFTSANVFQNIVLALTGEIPDPYVDEEIDVEQIALGVSLILILQGGPLHFDYQPVQFVARELHNEGYFLAPKILAFAQEELDNLNENVSVKEEVKKALEAGSEGSNDILKNQVTKHHGVTNYLLEHDKTLKKYESFMS